MATPKLRARGKGIATKHPKFPAYETNNRPSVRILSCIGFQKFRYCGENRPGKKYQEKDFLQLALHNMSGKNVRIQIVCFDAERPGEIHPNGLVGKDCEHGIYNKTYPISKTTQVIRIPYLRTERILTKKKKENEEDNINSVLKLRSEFLPSPYKERCLEQCKVNRKFDTTRVCFGIIVTMEDSKSEPLLVLSNVVQNASEKTTLNITKLSVGFVSAQEGGIVDIFTSEDGPPIIAGKCTVRVKTHKDGWLSEETRPSKENIMYKRVVTYQVPPYRPHPATNNSVPASLILSCTQSGQSCEIEFLYEPGADSGKRMASVHNTKPLRKRPYVTDEGDDEFRKVNGADSIKLRVKEKVQSRQNLTETINLYDLHSRDDTQENESVVSIPGQEVSIPSSDIIESQHTSQPQDDIIWAQDAITGEIVYLRASGNQSSENVVVYVHDNQQSVSGQGTLVSLMPEMPSAPKAVEVPALDWNSVASTAATSNSLRTLAPVAIFSSPSERHQSLVTRSALTASTPRSTTSVSKSKFVSPWIVNETESAPLIIGESTLGSVSAPSVKQEIVERPPTLATLNRSISSSSNVLISSETVPEVCDSGNLPSLGSLFNPSMLEGNMRDMKFDDTGNLMSSSVFEMIQPYMRDLGK